MATPRPSFTLLEMVLVLALLVILAAISIPAIDAQYASYRVHAAADQVRARWADARTQAVNDGRPYRFAVVRNRGNFRIAPDSPEYWSGNGSEDRGGALLVEEALPRGIRFVLGDLTNEDLTNDTVLPPENVAADMYTGVVLFLPTGAALSLDSADSSEVRILFQTRHAPPVEVKLRTLTGTVSARTVRANELP